MAFAYFDSFIGHPILIEGLIDDSEEIEPGDAVTAVAKGYVEIAAAGESVLGIVTAIRDSRGRTLLPERDTAAELGDATIASGVLTAGSDNTTDNKHYAIVDVSPFTRWSADFTGTLGTTANSGRGFCFADLTDENDIAESTATRGGTAQFYVWGTNTNATNPATDPNSTTKVIVSISESEPFRPATVAT